MRKKLSLIIIFIFILVVIIGGAVLLDQNIRKTIRACFQDHCFDVELAVKPSEQRRGLMFRERLDLDKGMLFIFKEEKEHSFWMKNTLIPLDIIWINNNKEVIFISESTLPCKEDSCPIILPIKKAKYVLEINGGMIKQLGLILGDKIDFDI